MALFNKKKKDDQEKMCIYCFHSERIDDSDACVCDICGMVRADGVCKKFKCDLLKVDPSPKNEL